jgi:hypothetical protein
MKFQQEREAPRRMIELGPREIRYRVQRNFGGAQAFQQRDATFDGAGHHLVPLLVVGANLGGVFWKHGDPFGDRLRIRAAAIKLEVLRAVTHMRQEPLDLRRVVEQLTIEPPRVPMDEDVADIEDND